MDEQQFQAIYNEHADAIFRFCFFRTSNRDTAKDLTQECFIRTWQTLEKGKQIENVRAFLYKVAGNLVIDHYRKHKEASLDELKEKGLDFVKEIEESTDFMDVQHALEEVRKLPEKYRRVVELRYVEDLSPGQIASIVGGSENSVSVRIHRGVEMLKKQLHDQE